MEGGGDGRWWKDRAEGDGISDSEGRPWGCPWASSPTIEKSLSRSIATTTHHM